MRRLFPIFIPTVIFAATACGADSTSVRVPALFTIASGDAPHDTVGGIITDSAAVLVEDDGSNPLANASVEWVAGANGSVDSAFTLTSAQGLAWVRWTFNFADTAQAGVSKRTMTATIHGMSVTFTATAAPGNAATITIAQGDGQTGSLRTTLANPFIAHVVDRHGFGVPNDTLTWTPTFANDSLHATLNSIATHIFKTLTDANGDSQAYLSLDGTLGTHTVTVTATTKASNGNAATVGPVTFTAHGT